MTNFKKGIIALTIINLIIHLSLTWLILTKGAAFDGKLIQLVSTLMIDSSNMAGLVVSYALFVVFLFVLRMVFIKGADRISEVAASFALDSMPSKQMIIEADYNSGLITEEEYMTRKNTLQREVYYYTDLRGTIKFISGNFLMGIFITGISIIVGIVIGTKLHGEDLISAAGIYTPSIIVVGYFIQFTVLLETIAVGIISVRSEGVAAV